MNNQWNGFTDQQLKEALWFYGLCPANPQARGLRLSIKWELCRRRYGVGRWLPRDFMRKYGVNAWEIPEHIWDKHKPPSNPEHRAQLLARIKDK